MSLRNVLRPGLALGLLLGIASIANAQWQIVATKLAPGKSSRAMTYRDGVIWIAGTELSISTDLGATWQSHTWPNASYPFDIDFFDRNNGVAAGLNWLLRTSDGGLSWTPLASEGTTSACFGKTTNEIAAAFRTSLIRMTTDGGLTWKTAPRDGFPFCVRRLRDGSISAFQGNSSGGYLFNTKDGGQTWQRSAGYIDYDSFSFGQDSCDAATFYVSNEDMVAPSDMYSSIFITRNGGATWQREQDAGIPTYAGSLAVTPNAVYCPTTFGGILRSTDQGTTWKNIGGPTVSADTRLIAAISDNLVFVVDDSGNVWRTTNSGGDSVFAPSSVLGVTASRLDFGDTATLCSQPFGSFRFLGSCRSPVATAIELAGPDTSAFTIKRSGDTVTVTFLPTEARAYTSLLRVLLSNGDTLAPIPLTGSARSIGWTEIRSVDAYTDTIGGDIYLPIVVTDRSTAGSLSFHISYDTTDLEYIGAYAGLDADATTARTKGAADIVFRDLVQSTDTIAGYLHFRVFPQTTACTNVTIDSIRFSTQSATCTLTLQKYEAQVCWGANCNSPMLSRFVRYGAPPVFSVRPNPASDRIEILSTQSMSYAFLSVVDASGRTVLSRMVSLVTGSPLPLDVRSFPAGAYVVTIEMSGATHRERFVLER